ITGMIRFFIRCAGKRAGGRLVAADVRRLKSVRAPSEMRTRAEIRMLPSPSPRPSPLGRGRLIDRPRCYRLHRGGVRFSLSQRERAGVRGKKAWAEQIGERGKRHGKSKMEKCKKRRGVIIG